MSVAEAIRAGVLAAFDADGGRRAIGDVVRRLRRRIARREVERSPSSPMTRDERRSSRAGAGLGERAVTMCANRTTPGTPRAADFARHLRVLSQFERHPGDAGRPRTRGDCIDGPRPCPWVSCKYHLALDVKPNGALQVNFPETDVDEMRETCALDVADRGGVGADAIGGMLNVVRERGRQILEGAVARLREGGGLEEHRDHEPAERRSMWDAVVPPDDDSDDDRWNATSEEEIVDSILGISRGRAA